jgi:hypothetical protein
MRRSFTYLSLVFAAGLSAVSGCSSSSSENDGDHPEDASGAALEIDEFSFDLDNQRLLSSLTDEEIGAACADLARTLTQAEELAACQIQAAAATNDATECSSAVNSCLSDPSTALAESEVTATPAPIDCDAFNAELTADCDKSLAVLEVCINSLAQSLAPSRNALSCEGAAEVDSVEDANDLARANKGSGYVADCFALVSCDVLVSTLIGGGN